MLIELHRDNRGLTKKKLAYFLSSIILPIYGKIISTIKINDENILTLNNKGEEEVLFVEIKKVGILNSKDRLFLSDGKKELLLEKSEWSNTDLLYDYFKSLNKVKEVKKIKRKLFDTDDYIDIVHDVIGG